MFAAKNELFTTPSGYQIQRSLRFRSSASAYLNRTPASAGNRQIFTISAWVKRGKLTTSSGIFGAGATSANEDRFIFAANDTLLFDSYIPGTNFNLNSTAVYRDPAAWYHVIGAVDTTQATASNRVKLYVNGTQITSFVTATYPAQNANCNINNNVAQFIGTNPDNHYLDGYMAEVNFIDGQALTPSSFGAINAVTGVWSATKYNGTYGTNGFYLNFSDNSAATATTIGKDYSGNGNNWTPNNISVTAGSTYDSMLDAPLGAGGGERGNYAVLNPLEKPANDVLANANLQFTGGTSGTIGFVPSTVGVSSGKWYFEVTLLTSARVYAGIVATSRQNSGNVAASANPDGYDYRLDTGDKRNNNTATAYGNSLTANDVLGCAFNLDTGKIWWSKNGTWQASGDPAAGTNEAFSGISGTFCGEVGHDSYAAPVVAANFGQRPFSYTPPTGFKALHTGNLAAPVIALPAQNMAATTYTGTGAAQSISNAVNGVSMQPDWVWTKSRSAVESHRIYDSVRGTTNSLFSNSTAAESTEAQSLTAFGTSGFTLGTGAPNTSAATYVAWQWKAGGTAVTNTAGSITSSVSANTTAGFSVVTYTGTGANATVGHGLGVAPSMVIVKSRSSVYDWGVYHSANTASPATQRLLLSTTSATDTNSTYWNNTAPASSVFSLGSQPNVNNSASTFVAYCFAPVAGYSAFGSYTGNASTDGPFVFTGFRPRFVLIKCSSTTGNWIIWDSSRGTYNVIDSLRLYPNLSDAEGGGVDIDFVSNGFKFRNTNAAMNGSGSTYIYMAFAEVPFKSALGR